jgi:hypothetical protein
MSTDGCPSTPAFDARDDHKTANHAGLRVGIPREILRQVIKATYASVWWPRHDRIVCGPERVPVWDSTLQAYVDPDTGTPLPTWDQALDELDDQGDDAEPVHVLRFGQQSDMQGIIGGSPAADRRVGYLTKYLTKAITDPLGDEDDELSAARWEHIDRLHDEVRWFPCSPRCWNWLAYGVQPENAVDGAAPGSARARPMTRNISAAGGAGVSSCPASGPARP